MITIVAMLEAKPGKEEELNKALLELIKPTRKEAGCINYDLHRSEDDPKKFFFYENWTGKSALDEHMASPHLTGFVKRAKELLAKPLDVKFYKMVSEPAG
ncbi:MAG: antibiotic biosynthesis monooxygenase [Deltaproteobacteria bacterium]|nr:antibiotic biosynthesis monooxygenase [Deltaproteobacteria bacterium]